MIFALITKVHQQDTRAKSLYHHKKWNTNGNPSFALKGSALLDRHKRTQSTGLLAQPMYLHVEVIYYGIVSKKKKKKKERHFLEQMIEA